MKKFRFFSSLALISVMIITNYSGISVVASELTHASTQSCLNYAIDIEEKRLDNLNFINRIDCKTVNLFKVDSNLQINNPQLKQVNSYLAQFCQFLIHDFFYEKSYPTDYSKGDKQHNTTSNKAFVSMANSNILNSYVWGKNITINKTSLLEVGLPDYEYTIYDNDDNVVEVIVTDEDGIVHSDILPPGDYYVEQTGAPNGKPINSQRLNASETVSIVNVEDESSTGKTNISVNIEGDNINQLGVYLTHEDGTFIDYNVCDENGTVNFDEVPSGTYHLILDRPSRSFFKDASTHQITVAENDEYQHYDIFIKVEEFNEITLVIVVLVMGLILVFVSYFLRKSK